MLDLLHDVAFERSELIVLAAVEQVLDGGHVARAAHKLSLGRSKGDNGGKSGGSGNGLEIEHGVTPCRKTVFKCFLSVGELLLPSW